MTRTREEITGGRLNNRGLSTMCVSKSYVEDNKQKSMIVVSLSHTCLEAIVTRTREEIMGGRFNNRGLSTDVTC